MFILVQIKGGDPWCSSGGLAPDGTLVGAGGFADGGRTLRYIGGGACQECEWREYDNVLAADRWYVLMILKDYFYQCLSHELLPYEHIEIYFIFLCCVNNAILPL